MSICLKCHRPIKDPIRWGGYGPVCAKAVQPVHEVERDLFGYDIEAAALAALARQDLFVAARGAQAKREVDAEFKAAWARWEARA